ncbi:MAG TPA: D-glycero-beta-D-manno-heptose 1-phosphate adenylyltransferase [Saprospiraceae bacterium]|nr:D-glycero-beta-D-manno-heptose 1-phosphate adenylyltransferase [Saprospiraceae bacterium]
MPQPHRPAQQKIYDLPALLKQVDQWHNEGNEIVFTNGCFDILHAGHIAYLESAAALGDRLIVGVNDDDSVKRLKGITRPINVLASRLYLLASLSCVDAVVPFSEDTPLELIRALRPDVLVKGGDYAPENIVGAEDVMSWGGDVKVIPYIEGFSTSKLESKILQLHNLKSGDA